MLSYTRICFSPVTPEQSGLLVSLLMVEGFDAFEEGEGTLVTYVPGSQFDPRVIRDISSRLQVEATCSEVPATNWNARWESGFEPVVVKGAVSIRASFHAPVAAIPYDIIITPRMSFGTGHHATTWMMVERMLDLDVEGKAVLDFGTGTAVLAILAAKRGAERVLALDNDDWSISNAADNLAENQVTGVELRLADNAATGEMYDIILANINRNVILENTGALSSQLTPGGTLLLSGFLPEDVAVIRQTLEEAGLQLSREHQRDNWMCLSFSR